MATRLPLSCCWNGRPASMETPSVEKYSGLTETNQISSSRGEAAGVGASTLHVALSAPCIGRESAMPTASTYGMDRTRSIASRIKRARSEGAVYRVDGTRTVAVKTWRGSYPTREDSTFQKLRINKPNTTSRTIPRATCTPINAFRQRLEREPPATFCEEIFKSSFGFARLAWNAGIIPKTMALTREIPRLRAKTRALTCKYAPGINPDATLEMAVSQYQVTITATAPPQRNSRTDSVRNCRIIRPREQPSATRKATSFRRLTPRASSMLATFAQEISSTSPAAIPVMPKPRRAFSIVGPGC